MDQFSKTSIYDFVRRLDKKRDGYIDYDEFTYAFAVRLTSFCAIELQLPSPLTFTILTLHKTAFSRSLSQEDIPWIKTACEKVGVEVKSVENLRNLFKKYGMKKVSNSLMRFSKFSLTLFF